MARGTIPGPAAMFGAAFLLALAAGSPAFACSCKSISQAEAMKGSAVVFQGRVLDVRVEGDGRFATIEVIRPIKGGVQTVVEVGTRASAAACGYPFRRGEVVIVGASFTQQQYRTNMCVMYNLNRDRRQGR